MVIVLANGCFDVLHLGHVEHLKEAKAMGDILFISLTLDEYVNKGLGRPINAWADRLKVLKELRCVDGVFATPNAVTAIKSLRPNIFVKGIDYAGKDKFTEDIEAACKEVGAELRFTTTAKRTAWKP